MSQAALIHAADSPPAAQIEAPANNDDLAVMQPLEQTCPDLDLSGPDRADPLSQPAAGENLARSVCPPYPEQPPDPPNLFRHSAVILGKGTLRGDWRELSHNENIGSDALWREQLGNTEAMSENEILARVNRWINTKVAYIDERVDQWSPAIDTLIRRQGDCEDIAIAKMALLQRLGFPQRDLFLILLREKYRPMDHAILAVRTTEGMSILDSKTNLVLPETAVTDYEPTFAYSGEYSWIYGKK